MGDAARDAYRRWRLAREELDYYGIANTPERWGDYLSYDAWKTVRKRFTDPFTNGLLDNKWLFAKYYGALGLPLPDTYGLLHPTQGHSDDGIPMRTEEDVISWLSRSGTRQFVAKPISGLASRGLVIVDDISWLHGQPQFLTPAGILNRAEFDGRLLTQFRKTTGCILQERAIQNPALDELGLGLPGTLRVVTFVLPDGTVVPEIAAYFVGRRGQMVNSWDEGAVSISVSIDDGRLGHGRTILSYGTAELDSHPDGASKRFVDSQLPDWDRALEIAVEAARMTPNLPVVCWEILLTDKGPKLLEGNLGFGLTILQVHTPGFLRTGFGDKLRQLGADLPTGHPRWGRSRSEDVRTLERRVLRQAVRARDHVRKLTHR